MKTHKGIQDDEIDLSAFDLEERAIATRRQLMYSHAALEMALLIENLFVNHPSFTKALAALDRVFQLATKVEMPHGLRLVGPTGTGKTSLLRYFQRSLPPSSLFSPGLGAVYVRVPMRATATYLVGALLRQYGYPFKRITYEVMEQRINILIDAIRQKGTQMVMLDEAQNLASEAQRKRLNRNEGTSPTDLIRLLMDEARVGIVLSSVGSHDDLGELDSALASRVVGRLSLDPFKYDAVWVRLCQGFVQQATQLDISILMEPEISQKMHGSTQGNLRNLKRMLMEMVLVAVDEGAKKVELKHLVKAFDLVHGAGSQNGNPFEPPSA